MMAKPMSVVRQELIDRLVDDVNNCGLPMFVVEPILQDILSAVKNAAQQQYEQERKAYERQLVKSTSENQEVNS